jgi:hypothetical protein
MQTQQLLFILIITFFSISFTRSQDTGISVEVFYPIQKTTEYSGDLTGILGLALQFQFTDYDKANFGAEYRYDMIQGIYNVGNNTTPGKKNYSFSNLGVFSKINLDQDALFKLYAGSGMDIFNWGSFGGKKKYIGYYFSGGLSYDLLEQWYILEITNGPKLKKRPTPGIIPIKNNSPLLDLVLVLIFNWNDYSRSQGEKTCHWKRLFYR